MTKPLLEVDGVCVDFNTDHGPVRVVDTVSFGVNPGETVALVGESGSGKTMTGLAIMGLVPEPHGRLAAGTVTLDGERLTDLGERQLENVRGRDVAMVFQEPLTSLNPVYRIGDQIGETIRRHKGVGRAEARDLAAAALDRVGIPQARRRLRSYPHELSGGQRQRAMIAMAISCEPRLLIADEPTTALDVTIQAQVLELLREMQAELGLALLFITHDLGVVANVADRVVVMYAGQVAEEADVDDCFERPTHPYTAGLLQAMPQVGSRTERLSSIPGAVPLPWEFREGCRFLDRCEFAAAQCNAPVPLLDIDRGRRTRCARVEGLELEGVT